MAPDAKEIRQAEREAKQDEKARLRQEKTDAYIKLENAQEKLAREVAALETQLAASPAPTSTAATEIQRVIDAKNEEIARLEKELEKIYNSTLGFVVGRSKKQRLEDMVGHASGAESTDRPQTQEQIAELKADTEVLAAQHLLDAGLLPSDLKGGPRMEQAARLIGRPGATPAELSAFADLIQPAYDIEARIKKAAEDKEKGVIVGRTMDAIKEVAHNPAKMGGAALGLLGAWLLYSAVGHGPSDGAMKWAKGILGVLGLGVGVGVATGALSFKNIGLGDAVESVTGVRADQAFSTAEMDQVRAMFSGMPTEDTDAVDNFISIMDAPLENVAAMFDVAFRNGATKVESSRLHGNGISAKESKFINEGSLYTATEWFFMECYEMGLAKGEIQASTDKKSQLSTGVEWARKNFKGHKMGTCAAAMELVRLGSAGGAAETGTLTVEAGVSNPALAKLEKDVPSFGEVLEKTTRADVYLLNGYPVRYNHTDKGDHLFADALDPTKPFTPVDAVLTGDALEVTLRGISTDALERARAAYAAAAGVAPAAVKYNEKGHWELEPPKERVLHAGLPRYLREPTDPKVPVILYYDAVENKLRIGKDEDKDGKPELRSVPYTSTTDVANEFERGILEKLIKKDIDHVMLGVQPSVGYTAWRDVGTTTEITITYGGAKGTVVYENDELKSCTLGPDALLEAKWTPFSEKKVADFLGRPDVQQELIRATTAYTSYKPGMLDGWMTKISGLLKGGVQWLKDDSITAAFHSDWEDQVIKEMTKLVYDPVNGMPKKYVDHMFRTFHKADQFQIEENNFFDTQLTTLQRGVVGATVVPEKEPDYQITGAQAIEMVNYRGPKGGTARLSAALEPLKSEVPAQMPSRFQSAYQGMKNLFTDDAVRTQWFDDKVAEHIQKLRTAVAAIPAPVTTDKVNAAIEAQVALAQTEALSYHGLNNKDAVKKLLVAPAEGGHADWKAASELVASYVSENMKWEKYAFIPNPENMSVIMDLWYARMGNPATAPKPGEADQYAKYFIWELQARMGGHQDYSPEYFYGEVQAVSDTNFKGMITSLTSAVQPYTVWTATPELRPPTPDMLPAIDKHRENLKVRFDKWFNEHADCGALFKLDHYWPQVFEGNVRDRFAQIINNPSATIATLDRDVKAFTEWVWVERWMVMEPLMLNRVEAENKGFDIRVRIFNKFPWFFYPEVNRAANYPRYIMMIKQQMRDIMSSQHTFPNMPGVPFL